MKRGPTHNPNTSNVHIWSGIPSNVTARAGSSARRRRLKIVYKDLRRERAGRGGDSCYRYRRNEEMAQAKRRRGGLNLKKRKQYKPSTRNPNLPPRITILAVTSDICLFFVLFSMGGSSSCSCIHDPSIRSLTIQISARLVDNVRHYSSRPDHSDGPAHTSQYHSSTSSLTFQLHRLEDINTTFIWSVLLYPWEASGPGSPVSKGSGLF